MSCNPAIAACQGHLVREVDRVGWGDGGSADAVGIQFRLLNTSRGPPLVAARSMDKKLYRARMREVLEQEPNIRIKQAEVAALNIEAGRATGVTLRDGRTLECGAVVRHRSGISEWLGTRWGKHATVRTNGEAPSQCWANSCEAWPD